MRQRGIRTVGLSNWGTVAITDMGKFGRRGVGQGRGGIKSLDLAMSEFEMPVRHPSGNVKLGDGNMIPELPLIQDWRWKVSQQITCSI